MSLDNCDHNGLRFIKVKWEIECVKCKKKWNSDEVKQALRLLDVEEVQGKKLYEIQWAINLIQSDITYIRHQLAEPTITVTGVSE